MSQELQGCDRPALLGQIPDPRRTGGLRCGHQPFSQQQGPEALGGRLSARRSGGGTAGSAPGRSAAPELPTWHSPSSSVPPATPLRGRAASPSAIGMPHPPPGGPGRAGNPGNDHPPGVGSVALPAPDTAAEASGCPPGRPPAPPARARINPAERFASLSQATFRGDVSCQKCRASATISASRPNRLLPRFLPVTVWPSIFPDGCD